MARPREPIELIMAKGKKNLTKAEISERRASEVKPRTEGIEPPTYLTAAQKRHFIKLAGQLAKIKVMGETDCDTLARYVTAESQYEEITKELRKTQKEKPDRDDHEVMADYMQAVGLWNAIMDTLDKRQDRYFKQASALARDLGLTISSRCKLVVPKTEDEKPKVNKFAQFGGKAAGAK